MTTHLSGNSLRLRMRTTCPAESHARARCTPTIVEKVLRLSRRARSCLAFGFADGAKLVDSWRQQDVGSQALRFACLFSCRCRFVLFRVGFPPPPRQALVCGAGGGFKRSPLRFVYRCWWWRLHPLSCSMLAARGLSLAGNERLQTPKPLAEGLYDHLCRCRRPQASAFPSRCLIVVT